MSAVDSLFDVPADDFDESLTDNAPHWRRERFIPLRKAALAQQLKADFPWSTTEGADFGVFCRLLEAILHHEYHARLEHLKQQYADFDPDAIRHTPAIPSHQANSGPFFRQLFDLLRRANYQRLTQTEIEDAVSAASDWGVRLQVNFTKFAQLGVFARGDIVTQRQRKHWRNFFRPEVVDVPIYQRLVVAFQVHNSDNAPRAHEGDAQGVLLKLFKNVPKQDIDMLLPGSQFQMSLLDRGRILLPTVSGLVIVTAKIINGALFAIFTGFWGVLAFLGFAGGTVGYGIKSFLGYVRTKDQYQLRLTRSLYYQNLDNNEGVLFRLLDEAEEQDFSEALFGYVL